MRCRVEQPPKRSGRPRSLEAARREARRARTGAPPLLPAVELLHQVAQAGAAVALAAEVLAVIVLTAVAAERLDREGDLAVLEVHVDDLDLDLLPLLHHVAGVLDALVLHLGDVHQPLDARLELDEGAEVGDLGDLALEAR